MGNKKNDKKPKNVPLSRKDRRKQERKAKKAKRAEHYENRNRPKQPSSYDSDSNKVPHEEIKESNKNTNLKRRDRKLQSDQKNNLIEKNYEKENKKLLKLQKEMNEQRKKQLLEANIEEDRIIKSLGKQLKLNKSKSKTIPKSFCSDGLDYILELCDPRTMESSVLAGQNLNEGDDSEDYLATVNEPSEDTNTINSKSTKKLKRKASKHDDDDNNMKKIKLNDDKDDYFGEDDESELEEIENEEDESDDIEEMADESENTEEMADESEDTEDENSELEPIKDEEKELENTENDSDDVDHEMKDLGKGVVKRNVDGTWEDIYGRLRTSDGAIINTTIDKYVPPAIRDKLVDESKDKKRSEKLDRLNKHLKGLLNRLAERNMHSIATQIEELYMNNSRNDMNETITTLILNAVASNIIAPERLLMEHVLLIVVLHANVGTEVGAHFLQKVVKQFDHIFNEPVRIVEDKQLDNIINIIAQLYNFRVCDSKLIYEILARLTERFEEKDVECILHVLRSVGFTLRKDNPAELKTFILNVHKKASEVSEEVKNNPRVKFMHHILLAIKNNNVSKIPNYDTSHSEHLKKIMKSFIRSGNGVTQLNISLQDLLKADERGRWWVVGSAWSGNSIEKPENQNVDRELVNDFSEKVLNIARKQRMNTDTRRNIFCVLMTAEDYLDAFEKLLRLSLKGQQEREIMNVILHCCQQEPKFNPYYALVVEKFIKYNRKYQMMLKCSLWDKFKILGEYSGNKISNLANFLIHLFTEKALPISVLKVIEFADLEKTTIRFIRQIILGILLHENLSTSVELFGSVVQSDKLKMFRLSLRLFIHHFLLRNFKTEKMPEEKRKVMEERAKMVDKMLKGKDVKKYCEYF